MSNGNSITATTKTEPETVNTTLLKDFLSLIKIGIVNSNLITTFTGIWLAFQFTNRNFLKELDLLFLTLFGTALIIAGSAAMNNFIDRDIDPVMKSKRTRPTVTGRFTPSAVLITSFTLLVVGEILLFMASTSAGVWGLAGIISYVVLYSMWSKRRYVSNTIVGSISGAIPPLIGWAAVEPSFKFWSISFILNNVYLATTTFLCACNEDEQKNTDAAGIPMLPVVKGFERTKSINAFMDYLLVPITIFINGTWDWLHCFSHRIEYRLANTFD